MKVVYSDTFQLPLPEGHRFPIARYGMLRQVLQTGELRNKLQFRLAPAVTDEQLLRVHTAAYLRQLTQGTLSTIQQKRIGFPWSPAMVERARRSTGGTLAAARAALQEGIAAHLAGGTHHACADHGQGFCVFNDVAVTIRNLQSQQLVRRALVIDLDVHQGNGTAQIFANDPTVYTFSVHGAHNYPFAKYPSNWDVSLPDGTNDQFYLSTLTACLPCLPWSDVDIVFYLAGADPFQDDRLGRMKLSMAGLAQRDRLVLSTCRRWQLPMTIVLAGGYARRVEDIVAINAATIELSLQSF